MSATVWLLAWLGACALFLFWYGGRTRPLGADEVTEFMQELARAGIDRDDPELHAALQRLLAEDDGREFVMVNLIRYREKAAYPPGSGYGDSAIEADRRYARAFFPYLLRYGNLPIYVSRRSGSFIEPQGATGWQIVALVRYRSRRDLIRTARAVMGRDIMIHKWAAIDSTHVFPTRPVLTLFVVRSIVMLLFIAAAMAGLTFGNA